ncbi:MAG: hypothetical protein WD335_03255 [Candidatus Paceibacterota bacterium]
MKKSIIITILIIVLLALGLWFALGQRTSDEEASDLVSTRGVVTNVDTSATALDGPIVIEIETDTGMQTVTVPSFGFNLCPAKDNITDPFELEVGDTVSVQGDLNNAGEITLCKTQDDYLRQTTSTGELE